MTAISKEQFLKTYYESESVIQEVLEHPFAIRASFPVLRESRYVTYLGLMCSKTNAERTKKNYNEMVSTIEKFKVELKRLDHLQLQSRYS